MNLTQHRVAHRLGFLLPLIGLLAGLAMGPKATAAELPRDRPNVILIITDDQGYGDVGAHGNRMIQTPHLDRLARESVRLTNFHVDPTCAETRSALMSGRYSCRVGVWHTIMGRSLLDPAAVTLADAFQANGYRTGMFGKWHLGDQYPLRPQDRGFETVLCHGGGGVGQTPDAWGNDYFDDRYADNGEWERQSGYCTDVFFDAARAFIREHRDEPFFCYLATNAPHGPYLVEPRYAQPYEDQGVAQPMANFYGMITNIDENLGRLREDLREWGLAENTLLIFMTDNGTAAGARAPAEASWPGYNAGMRGQKGSPYDGGHRVPCFWHWPAGRWTEGTVDGLTAHFDLFPTLAEVCGLSLNPAPSWDGQSLVATLRGDVPTAEPRTLVVHSQRIEMPEKWRKTAVMQDHWRLVNETELYDLRTDPGQTTNVADQYPDRVNALQVFYDDWWKASAPAFAHPVRIALGAPEENPTRLNAHDWHAPQAQVPWNQTLIARDLAGSGYWTLEVKRSGRYRLELRMRPEEVAYTWQSGTYRIQIGDEQLDGTLPEGNGPIEVEVALEQGPVKLQSWVEEQGKAQRGAYYVTVTWLGAEVDSRRQQR